MQRSGQSAATMLAVRAPQSKPARIAFSILSASIKAMTSTASADGWPLRTRVARKEARRAVAAQIGNDHPIAGRRQQRRDIDEAVDVVGPAVQENDRRAIGRTGFGIADIEHAGIDLLQRAEGGVRPRLDGRQRASSAGCAPQSRSSRAARRRRSRRRRRRSGGDRRSISFMLLMRVHLAASWLDRCTDQPNVNAKASTPGSRNSISNCRSAMGFGCLISW